MTDLNGEWFFIENAEELDSPVLVVYEERVRENIRLVKQMVPAVEYLRPHVKTHKMAAVARLMLEAGIYKFKCATIAEAEMLAQVQAPDVLLAYQPVGPKAQRLAALMKAFPATHFSCLVDNTQSVDHLSYIANENRVAIDVYLDLNVGMNRTGIHPDEGAFALFEYCLGFADIHPVGFHAYDGHIHDTDLSLRRQRSDTAFEPVKALVEKISGRFGLRPAIVAGGTPTFPIHAQRPDVECSPGTFVFWDWGYRQEIPDEPFVYAALVITRVISIVDEHTICTDLGHKSVAAEKPLPRVHFLNAPDVVPIGQSEEHLVAQVPDASRFSVGDLLYGVPVHICPTVSLYEKATVVSANRATAVWPVTARGRQITY